MAVAVSAVFTATQPFMNDKVKYIFAILGIANAVASLLALLVEKVLEKFEQALVKVIIANIVFMTPQPASSNRMA